MTGYIFLGQLQEHQISWWLALLTPASDICLGSLPWTLILFWVPTVYQDSWQSRAPLRNGWGKRPNLQWWGLPQIRVLPYTLLLYFSKMQPMFKPKIFIQNKELETYLHKQHCNLMLSLQGAPHPYMLCPINRYWCPHQPPPPTTHTTFDLS